MRGWHESRTGKYLETPWFHTDGLMSFFIAVGAAMALNPHLDLGIPPRYIALFVAWSGVAKLVYLAMSKQPGREENQKGMVDSTETPVVGAAVKPEA